MEDNSAYAKSWFEECGRFNTRKNVFSMQRYFNKNDFCCFLKVFHDHDACRSLNRGHKT